MDILKEENFTREIKKIRDKLDKNKVSGYFKGENGADIYYEYYKNTTHNKKNKAVVISHGYCETLMKYTEFIYYVFREGYSVYGIEHRGMSRSTHLAKDEDYVHVEDYMYYIKDLKLFVEKIVKREEGNNTLYLYAHSQGGLIGTGYVQKYPKDFAKLVLSSPYYRMYYRLPLWFAKLVARLMILLGKGEECIYRNKKEGKSHKFKGFNTSSKVRNEYNKKICSENKSFDMKGGTAKWFYECIKAQTAIFNKRNLMKLKPKILLISCGKDRMVDIKFHRKFKRAVYKCELYEIKEAKHEAYFESDEIQKKYYTKIFEFLDN